MEEFRGVNVKTAISFIEKHGILLVFPIDNRKEPRSLWSCFFPRSEMRWEWDDGGDDRVAKLWHLREQLSSSGQVIYAKWFRGRATVLSREVFTAMLSAVGSSRKPHDGLTPQALEVLGALELDSPMSTKELKLATDLRGKFHERAYERAMKELWSRLLIVGCGERDDGAFPSLLLGSTQLIFEELWQESLKMSAAGGIAILKSKLPGDSLFLKYFLKLYKT